MKIFWKKVYTYIYKIHLFLTKERYIKVYEPSRIIKV